MAPDELQAGELDELLELEGLLQGSADDKGRIKLPKKVWEYLKQTGETVFVVTTLDLETVRIYTRQAWRRNAAILDNATSEAARSVYYIAKVYASAGPIDGQGRLRMSPKLRKDLGYGREPVYFEKSKDHIEVYSEAVHQARLEAAKQNLPAKVREVEALGVR